MMSYEEEVSGYDLKKWIDWSVDLYYWSPSYSQIYTELKKLEALGLVTSRVERDEGTRSRRLYKITPAGMDAVTQWTNHAPVDPPVLKHSVLLRVTFGHLSNPGRLRNCCRSTWPTPRPGTARPWRTPREPRRSPRGRIQCSHCAGRQSITPPSGSSRWR
ncbi:PadR family transcriptional regulator [Mycobacterium avium subsp. paratuberculosis S5]|nr:PadR family transcriptional regulator [Mycobacterium avium subsp. paratuberculosis S5]